MHEEEDLEFLNELDPSELYDYIVERGDNTVESKEDLDALCQSGNRVYGCQLELSKFQFICGEKVTWGRVRGVESFLQKIKTIVTEK